MARGNAPPGCRCSTRIFPTPEEQGKPSCDTVVAEQQKIIRRLRKKLSRQAD